MYVGKADVFHRFEDREHFRDSRAEYGRLVWGEGELDMAPETFHSMATGKVVTYDRVNSSTASQGGS